MPRFWEEGWQGWQDSNPRHSDLEADALPTELHPYNSWGSYQTPEAWALSKLVR